MIQPLTEDKALKFKNLSAEEKSKKGILGRLVGPVASCVKATRNGRRYTEELWEKLFNSDLIQERFKNGGIMGELCHPDYEDICIEKVACIMPEPPVKDKNGRLVTYVDILDTPCGKVAYQLAKYGYKFGISSRGTGDILEGYGEESEVDPDTYQLNAFDLVEIPAVEDARLSFVESLDTKKNSLIESLKKSVDSATEAERNIMKEALNNLGIEIKEDYENYKDWEDSDIELHKNTNWAARDYKDLPVPEDSFEGEATAFRYDSKPEKKTVKFIKHIRPNPIFPPYYRPEEDPFEHTVGAMYGGKSHGKYDIHDRYEDQKTYDTVSESLEDREELSSYMLDRVTEFLDNLEDNEEKEMFLQDLVNNLKVIADKNGLLVEECNNESCADIDNDKDAEEVVNDKSNGADKKLVAEFQESLSKNSELEKDNLRLREKLSVCNAKESQIVEELNKYKKALANLSESSIEAKKLKESLASKNSVISHNNIRIENLLKKVKNNEKKLDESVSNIKELKEIVNTVNEDLAKKSKQLDASNSLLEKYKTSYKALKESYLEVKATSCGLSKSEVLNKLDESYKIKDIDSVCEQLSKYHSNLSKLPFKITEDIKVSAKRSDNEYILGSASRDDDISDYLLSLIK